MRTINRNYWLPELFNDIMNAGLQAAKPCTTAPATNVMENDEMYIVQMAAPGLILYFSNLYFLILLLLSRYLFYHYSKNDRPHILIWLLILRILFPFPYIHRFYSPLRRCAIYLEILIYINAFHDFLNFLLYSHMKLFGLLLNLYF